MKLNLFTIQVLVLIMFIPACVFLEFNHNKLVTAQQKTPGTLALIETASIGAKGQAVTYGNIVSNQ